MSETAFDNQAAALRSRDRIEQLTGVSLEGFFERAFVGNPTADRSLTNIERWLRATSNAQLYMEQIAGLSAEAKVLIKLLGSSQPIADTLIQNPELATVVLDPFELRRQVRRTDIVAEGRKLLSSATSHTHSLDRLRFLRQRWNLPIVINDVAGTWTQEVVWLALSELADALIELALDLTWSEFSCQKGISSRPEFMIIGFGKLGGRELNYSSDVDLAYVVENSLEERTDRECTRMFEAFGRALSDRMGRGSLYRVDLRLRPYGGAGPILSSMKAYEAYYDLYAEPWEVQALLRSRPIVGSPALQERWSAMRSKHCFRPKLSEIRLEEMLSMKARVEAVASADDLKRGEGGIRDVEFIAQIMQILHGNGRPALQVLATCDALRALDAEGFLEHSVTGTLIEGYTFLRKLEHKTQLVGDLQTHSIPSNDPARENLAALMGFSSWSEVSGILEGHRRTIHSLYRNLLNLESSAAGDRSDIQKRLGTLATAATNWFDGLPESSSFYHGLVENQDSLVRVIQILNEAPRLVSYFKSSVPLTELLMSGEILDRETVSARIQTVPLDIPLKQLAEVYAHSFAVILGRWTLDSSSDLGEELSALLDALLEHCSKRIGAEFSILGLGSYGRRESSPGSDADLLFLVSDGEAHLPAEHAAQHFLALLSQLHQLGAPVLVDLRLRPEGSKGLLVRSYDGLRSYDLDGMEMWERFALGNARLISGKREALEVVQHCAYSLPLTPDRLVELSKIKRRVETERVKPQHIHRQVKLGYGGLSDIEWLVHLHEMRYCSTTQDSELSRMTIRIRKLANKKHLNAVEADLLSEGWLFLVALRARIFLMGINDDLLPENPDKLDRLARSCAFPDGNTLLAKYQSVVEPVRRIYLDSLARLKS